MRYFADVMEAVVVIMRENNCRLMDSDIVRALKATKFEYSENNGFYNITVDTRELVTY